MAISRHFNHLRTNFKYEPQAQLNFDVIEPETTNKYELRRNRSHIKIPKRLSGIIAKDKSLLKPFATYFELKPLYYSSVIKDAKKHYIDIAAYLDICENTLRQRISEMLKLDLAWWDGKDLRLVAYRKICKRYALSNFYHKINNQGQTDNIIRTVSLKENLDNQAYCSNKKIIHNAVREEVLQNQLHKVQSIAKNYVVSIPQMVKRISTDNIEKIVSAAELRKIKRVIRLRMDILTKQSQERTDNNLLQGIKCSKTANPTHTLSCQSVAKLYGCNSISAGHYWETKLANLNFINVTPEAIEIKNKRSELIWQKQVNGENNGVWATKHKNRKTGERYYFLRLANNLSIINNPTNPLFI